MGDHVNRAFTTVLAAAVTGFIVALNVFMLVRAFGL